MDTPICPPSAVIFHNHTERLSVLVDDAGVMYFACMATTPGTDTATPTVHRSVFRQVPGREPAMLVGLPDFWAVPTLVRHPHGAYIVGFTGPHTLTRLDIPDFTVTTHVQTNEAQEAYERASDCLEDQSRQVREIVDLADQAVDIANAAKLAAGRRPTHQDVQRYSASAARTAVDKALDELLSWRDPRLGRMIESLAMRLLRLSEAQS